MDCRRNQCDGVPCLEEHSPMHSKVQSLIVCTCMRWNTGRVEKLTTCHNMLGEKNHQVHVENILLTVSPFVGPAVLQQVSACFKTRSGLFPLHKARQILCLPALISCEAFSMKVPDLSLALHHGVAPIHGYKAIAKMYLPEPPQ